MDSVRSFELTDDQPVGSEPKVRTLPYIFGYRSCWILVLKVVSVAFFALLPRNPRGVSKALFKIDRAAQVSYRPCDLQIAPC
jgi:hypothetical protein